MEKILGTVRRAVEDYDMISDGERIGVGVSGGKDSMALLMAMKRLSDYYPKKFTVVGITLDMGIEGMDISPMLEFADRNGIEFLVKKTKINEVVFNIRKENHPCSLCARLRRGALNNFAIENGIHKVALGHHYNDVAETFMLNLVFEGRLGCFSPVTYLDRKKVTIIRPLIYIQEKDIKACVARNNIPVIFNPCEANGNTERTEMKKLLSSLENDYKGITKQVFGAIQRSGLDGWKTSPRTKKD